MCDLHSQVTREVLVQLPAKSVPPGHPVDTFRRENEALREAILKMRTAIAAVRALPDDAAPNGQLLEWRQAYNDLMDIEKHYQRKEHAFFAKLERHGITGPSKVMWGKDDEVRGLLKELGRALREQGASRGRVEAGGRYRRRSGALGRGGDDLQGRSHPPPDVPGRVHRRRLGRDLDLLAEVRMVPRGAARGIPAGAGAGAGRAAPPLRRGHHAAHRQPLARPVDRHLLHPAGGPDLRRRRRPRALLLRRAGPHVRAQQGHHRAESAALPPAAQRLRGGPASSRTFARAGRKWRSSGSNFTAASRTSATSRCTTARDSTPARSR